MSSTNVGCFIICSGLYFISCCSCITSAGGLVVSSCSERGDCTGIGGDCTGSISSILFGCLGEVFGVVCTSSCFLSDVSKLGGILLGL